MGYMPPADSRLHASEASRGTIHLPAPPAWPITLAFGVTLFISGLVTSAALGILGAILFVAGCVGWFRDVFPQEKEETIDVKAEIARVVTYRREVERLSRS